MQTFLVSPSFKFTASLLDNKRLGKQRVEAWQILNANRKFLAHQDQFGPLSVPKVAWRNHPAVLMWRNYDGLLAMYGVYICKEWINRGFRDSLLDKFMEITLASPLVIPYWWAEERFQKKVIQSHQQSLIFKYAEHYQPLFPNVKGRYGYYWPQYTSPSYNYLTHPMYDLIGY
jgi:hypothetical protein